MRFLLIILLVYLSGCHHRQTGTDVHTGQGDTSRTNSQPTRDSDTFYYDEVRRSFLDKGDTVRTVLKGQKDSFLFTYKVSDTVVIIKCYLFQDGQWKNAGTFNSDKNGDRFETADLNFDGIEEMVLSSGPNMNGNEWKQVYTYDTLTHMMIYSGLLYGQITINLRQKTIEQVYTGSWYMAEFETQYNWTGHHLHALKTLTSYLSDDNGYMGSPRTYSYFANHSKETEDNEEIWHGSSNKDSAKFDSLWRHFFDK